MRYKIQNNLQGESVSVAIIDQNTSIPFCVDNTDYQRFKVDVEAGTELLDAEGNVMDGPAFVATLH